MLDRIDPGENRPSHSLGGCGVRGDWAAGIMRDAYAHTGSSPNVRLLGKASGVPVKELYALFPKGPAKLAARIAGVPKPRGCI